MNEVAKEALVPGQRYYFELQPRQNVSKKVGTFVQNELNADGSVRVSVFAGCTPVHPAAANVPPHGERLLHSALVPPPRRWRFYSVSPALHPSHIGPRTMGRLLEQDDERLHQGMRFLPGYDESQVPDMFTPFSSKGGSRRRTKRRAKRRRSSRRR
jgi:hypothetical protein